MTEEEIEAVARAFYESCDNARDWGREPEGLKIRFRMHARTAIAAIDERSGPVDPAEVGPLVVPGPLQSARGFLMEAQEISILPFSSFRAVFRGPTHIFEAENHEHAKFLGHRNLRHRPIRDAAPDLAEQGYFELLDQVYATRRTFIGQMLPVRLQKQPNGVFEEHIIDIVYRPVENRRGELLGLFVEGCDRTQRTCA